MRDSIFRLFDLFHLLHSKLLLPISGAIFWCLIELIFLRVITGFEEPKPLLTTPLHKKVLLLSPWVDLWTHHQNGLVLVFWHVARQFQVRSLESREQRATNSSLCTKSNLCTCLAYKKLGNQGHTIEWKLLMFIYYCWIGEWFRACFELDNSHTSC